MGRSSSQLEFDLATGGPDKARRGAHPPRRFGPRVRASARTAGTFVVRSVRIWLPLVVLVQFGLRGLRPAWDEHLRLDREEHSMQARVQTLVAERRAILRDARKLSDPVYRERVRKSLRASTLEPLLLDHPVASPTSR